MSMSHRSEGFGFKKCTKGCQFRRSIWNPTCQVEGNSRDSRNSRELEQTMKDESREWAFPMEALEMGNSQINEMLEKRNIYLILHLFPRIQKTRA